MATQTQAALDAMAELWEPDTPITSAHMETVKKYDAGWRPRLNPTQQVAYNDKTAKYMLLDGERATGKTIVGLHKLVDHCFNELNALAYVLVREIGQAKDGGAWDKLINWVLPTWKYGNKHPITNEQFDDGIGLEYSEPRMDMETKKQWIQIRNRYGTACRVICISFPHGTHVEEKIHGRELSFILIDEAQTCDNESYFTDLVQQVGRRNGIKGVQQTVYCANPEGPSHWLYKRFFEMPFDEATGEWDPAYARYHIPIIENVRNLPAGAWDRVIEACRGNPIKAARLLRGEWIDMPTGEAMFKTVFAPAFHVRGDAAKDIGIHPFLNHVCTAGYDLGPAHSSIHFLQYVELAGKLTWIVFDELNFVGQYLPYPKIVDKLLERMVYWDELMDTKFKWEHISDDSAFNQVRTDGSYDVQEIERLSTAAIKARKLDIKPIQLVAAPKGKGSVAARMRMLMELLQMEQIIVSATCYQTINMLMFMESAPPARQYDPDAFLTPRKSPHNHVADSLTYPMFYYRVGPMGGAPRTGEVKSSLVYFGR